MDANRHGAGSYMKYKLYFELLYAVLSVCWQDLIPTASMNCATCTSATPSACRIWTHLRSQSGKTDRTKCCVDSNLKDLHYALWRSGNLLSSSSLSTLERDSSWHMPGFSSSFSQRASSIAAVIRRGRPVPLKGALVLRKHRMFARIARMLRSQQRAAAAMSTDLTDLLRTIGSIMTSCDLARLGAMVSSCVVCGLLMADCSQRMTKRQPWRELPQPDDDLRMVVTTFPSCSW